MGGGWLIAPQVSGLGEPGLNEAEALEVLADNHVGGCLTKDGQARIRFRRFLLGSETRAKCEIGFRPKWTVDSIFLAQEPLQISFGAELLGLWLGLCKKPRTRSSNPIANPNRQPSWCSPVVWWLAGGSHLSSTRTRVPQIKTANDGIPDVGVI